MWMKIIISKLLIFLLFFITPAFAENIQNFGPRIKIQSDDSSISGYPRTLIVDTLALTDNGDGSYTHSIAGFSDSTYLKLDQTTPQTISNGFPVYPAGHAAFTDEHQIVDKEYVDLAVTAINTNYYMLDTASGISDYKNTQIAIPSEVEATAVDTITADDQYIQGWISPVGSISTLVRGEYELHVYADVDATLGTKRVQLYWTLVEYKADTSEVLIETSAVSDELTTTQSHISIFLTLPEDYTITAGSRIVGKLYAHLYGSGGNPQTTIYYLGDINSSWRIPTSTEVLDGSYVRRDGTTELTANWDAGNYTITANGLTIDGTFTDGTATLTGGVLNGLTDINATATTDLSLFGTTDVADDADGKKLIIHRKAVEGDKSLSIYYADSGDLIMDSSGGDWAFTKDGDEVNPACDFQFVNDQSALTELRLDNTNTDTDIDHLAFTLYDGSTKQWGIFHNNNQDTTYEYILTKRLGR